jgi:hypothetical protein
MRGNARPGIGVSGANLAKDGFQRDIFLYAKTSAAKLASAQLHGIRSGAQTAPMRSSRT